MGYAHLRVSPMETENLGYTTNKMPAKPIKKEIISNDTRGALRYFCDVICCFCGVIFCLFCWFGGFVVFEVGFSISDFQLAFSVLV